MNLRRVYLDEERNVVPPAQAFWMVETVRDSNRKVVRETWSRVVGFRPRDASAGGGRSCFIVAGILLFSASILLLLEVAAWGAVVVLTVGMGFFLAALRRR